MGRRFVLVPLAVLVLAIGGCGTEAGAAAAAAGDRYADALFVDVRTPDEYAAGHVDGALLIPYDELEGRLAELEAYRDRPIALYCRTGRRSGIALEILQRNGFTAAENAGAFTSLARQGLPTARGGANRSAEPGASGRR